MSEQQDVLSIEQRFESPRHGDPNYVQPALTDEQVAAGKHREWVGGKWDTMGRLQFDFLRSQGLEPSHRFIDVGCGSLRAGTHLVRYLDAGNYYGIDANDSVLKAGYAGELDDEQRAKLPVGNLRATERFDIDFGVSFDMGIAQSLFTHMSLNLIRLCLYRVARSMAPGARFFVTFFEKPDDFPVDGLGDPPRRLHGERNPYWYYRDDLEWAAEFSPWKARYIGDWGHPVGQKMFEFTKRSAS